MKRVSDMSASPFVSPSNMGPYIPIILSEVEQEQRPSWNRDREAIVVGARLRGRVGERAYTTNAFF